MKYQKEKMVARTIEGSSPRMQGTLVYLTYAKKSLG